MAEIVTPWRTRTKHRAFVRLVSTFDDLTGNVSSLVIEQSGFESHDFEIRFGEKGGPVELQRQKGGGFAIPIQDFPELDWRHRPIEDEDEVREDRRQRNDRIRTYHVGIRITLPADFRKRDGRMAWLEERRRNLMQRATATGSQADYDAAQYLAVLHGYNLRGGRAEREAVEFFAAHMRSIRGMADYESTGLETWSTNGNLSSTITLPAGTTVGVMAHGGYTWSGDTANATWGGTGSDDSTQADDGGDAAAIHAIGNPTTGSSIALATTGLDGGDTNIGCAFGVSSADGDEIAATGFPDTDESTSTNPSLTLTSASGDLAIYSYEMFHLSANPASNLVAPQSGDTEIFEGGVTADDSQAAQGYEQASGATVTVGVTASAEGNFDQFVAAIVPNSDAPAEQTVSAGAAALPIKAIAPADVVEGAVTVATGAAPLPFKAVAAAAIVLGAVTVSAAPAELPLVAVAPASVTADQVVTAAPAELPLVAVAPASVTADQVVTAAPAELPLVAPAPAAVTTGAVTVSAGTATLPFVAVPATVSATSTVAVGAAGAAIAAVAPEAVFNAATCGQVFQVGVDSDIRASDTETTVDVDALKSTYTLVDGDFFLVHVMALNTGGWTAPSEFSAVSNRFDGIDGATIQTRIYRRYVEDMSAESGTYTFSHNSGNGPIGAVVQVFRGVHPDHPIDVGALISSFEDDATPASPARSVKANGGMMVVGVQTSDSSITGFADPTGFTGVFESSTSIYTRISQQVIAAAGPVTPDDWGLTNSDGDEDGHIWSLVLRPKCVVPVGVARVPLKAVAPAAVSTTITVSAAPAEIPLVAPAPATSTSVTISAATATIPLKAVAPAAVSVEGGTQAVSTGTAQLPLVAPAPSTSTTVTVSTAAAAVPLVAPAASVAAGAATVSSAPAEIPLVAVAPAAVFADQTVETAAAELPLKAVAPAAIVLGAVTVEAAPAEVPLVAPAPNVVYDQFLDTAPAEIPFKARAASVVSVGELVVATSPAMVPLRAVAPAAVVTGAVTVETGTAQLPLVAPAPATSTTVTVSAAPAEIPLVAPAASVSTIGAPQTVSAAPAEVPLVAVAPAAVTVGAITVGTSPAEVPLKAVAPAAIVTGAVTIEAAPAELPLVAPAANVAITQFVDASPAEMALVAVAPAFAGLNIIDLTPPLGVTTGSTQTGLSCPPTATGVTRSNTRTGFTQN